LASLSLTVDDATFAFENTPGVDAVEATDDEDAIAAVLPVNDFTTNYIDLFQSDADAVEDTYDHSFGAFEAYKVVTVGTDEAATHTGYYAGAAALTYVSWGGWAFAEVDDTEAPLVDVVESDDATVGVFAAGYETPSASVPTDGTAVYAGLSSGVLIGDARDEREIVFSDVTANINFATGAVLFGSSGSSYDGLDFAVASTLADGAFTAAINEVVDAGAGVTMTGDVAGRLYGGDASELGGTFAALHSELGTYIGSFGARDVAAFTSPE
jgi:hypothetical protein